MMLSRFMASVRCRRTRILAWSLAHKAVNFLCHSLNAFRAVGGEESAKYRGVCEQFVMRETVAHRQDYLLPLIWMANRASNSACGQFFVKKLGDNTTTP